MRGWRDVTMADLSKLGRGSHAPAAGAKPSKYRNVKTIVDGIVFDSKREAQYWAELKLREKAGEISGLERQVSFPLCCPGGLVKNGVREYLGFAGAQVVAHYIADFVFVDRAGEKHVVDAKGKRTAMYQLKKKWLELQSGIVIEEV